MLAFLLIAYLVTHFIHIPLSFITPPIPVIFILLPPHSNLLHTKQLIKPAPSNILIFSIRIYLLIFPLNNLPITLILPHILSSIA
ncbi:ArsB/NhaD family transporter, partial [Staphylococcus epidermidis]|uniref:ArsB/NhaD family transporter n=1 Tax=Staphylococcus epidermidis TaxID=1282 RepID=UPI0028CB6BF3